MARVILNKYLLIMHPESNQGGTDNGKVTFILKPVMKAGTTYLFYHTLFLGVYSL